MSTLKTGALRGLTGTADSIQLHTSNQSVTFPGDVTCSGTATGFGGGNVKYTTSSRVDLNGVAVAEFTVPANCFSLWLTIRDLSRASTSNVSVLVQAGGSYVSSGYKFTSGYIESAGNTWLASEANDSHWHFLGGLTGAGHTMEGQFEMKKFEDHAWTHSWIGADMSSNRQSLSSGYIPLSSELQKVKVTSSSGNFDDGAITAHFLELL